MDEPPDIPPRLDVRPLKPYDERAVADLWSRRTGMGIENSVSLVVDDENAAYGLVVTEVETIIGFGIVHVAPPAGVEDYFPVDTTTFPVGGENALIHAVGVTEEWEGRNVGSALLYFLLDVVRDLHDIDAVFGNAWLRDHATDSAVLFDKHGFERLTTVEDFFQRTDGERNCPDCAPEACTCSSAIYAKPVP
jgi:GNAT superfamily N-acetyltransferase